jgi:hypothetical protein
VVLARVGGIITVSNVPGVPIVPTVRRRDHADKEL